MAYTNQRKAYGETLVALCRENKNIVVLDADLGGSTMGKMVEQAMPERHIEMGIAEANMTSVAGGLARVGKIPFTNSFAVFAAGRAYDQIRQSIAIGKLNVKICGSSAGFSDFGDGATHQSIDDIAYMRVIPNMIVLVPADANETVSAVKYMAAHSGPMYIRLNRNDYENVTEEDAPFQIGVPAVLREGTDVVVFACGIMVGKSLEAAKKLTDRVSVRVVNVSTIKPLNRQLIIDLARDCKGVVTAEEHSVIGGLGGAVAEALRRECKPIEFVGANDCFGSSAHSYDDILEYMGLTEAHIEEAILSVAK
ncbi:MAG: transketolase C-terminal domain-containing protein [Eubacteriales bacterium]|nr:transketolase C-terminal domain-containing protein [Eubacteriales bacterium]